jgi:peptidoglycan/xylan/chitin deacetylase (PgdA/CDA1 family)
MSVPTCFRPLAKKNSQLMRALPWTRRVRLHVRKWAGLILSLPAHIPEGEWIFFPYYHWVLDDERRQFDRQLKYFANIGQFISLDDAVDAMKNPAGIGGRYFCVTFDDGFKNNITNAMPIMVDNRCPGTIYVSTNFVGLKHFRDAEKIQPFFDLSYTYPLPFEFLDWDDCRKLHAEGMTIGSHTCAHTPLIEMSDEQIETELRESKACIERELNAPCLHFCCPWGVPFVTFDPQRLPKTAERVGYRSCATTVYGYVRAGCDPMLIPRRSMVASDSTSIIRYAMWQCRSPRCKHGMHVIEDNNRSCTKAGD